ncbi:hypothetical protein [Flavobacterium nitrogenifigens]|uniref:hypothetical protein n=1 Tax=Flavobacterium nitrogenifigens TaxID=1617283 RepID=UPI00319EC48E
MILWLFVFMIFIVFYCCGHGLQIRANGLSSFTKDNNVNVMTLLEIALQLLPEDEMELLDDLCRFQ